MKTPLQLLRELAPSLFCLRPEQVGIRTDCGAGEEHEPGDVPPTYARPTVRLQDGSIIAVDGLDSHHFEEAGFSGPGDTADEAVRVMLYVLRCRAQERIAALQRFVDQVPDRL